MDLPVWQALQDELADEPFTVITVSFDTRAPEQSRPWIEAVNPTYPCLLDPEHEVADLYNMVNVPNAVWIDEDGRIVRPAETAGTGDEFRTMVDPGGIPPDDLQRMMRRRQRYVDAIKDWVRNGTDVRSSTDRTHSVDDALAFAHFRFGTWLALQGRDEESRTHLAEARRLKPESWSFRRQSWELEEVGKAGSPVFWEAVKALGDDAYYPAPDLPGLDDD
jgi:hypothetical protein